MFVTNTRGSVGASRLSSKIRRAITEDSRVRPDELPRRALRQQYAATRAMVARWQRSLLAGARIAELSRANLYMFLSNEDEVLREVRAEGAQSRRG